MLKPLFLMPLDLLLSKKLSRGRNMAVDTRQKRMSMLNFGDGTNIHVLFEADGTVDADDRAHLLDLYSGIALASPVAIRRGKKFSWKHRRMRRVRGGGVVGNMAKKKKKRAVKKKTKKTRMKRRY